MSETESDKQQILMSKLLYIMKRLRDPESGCPWDIEQDFNSIAPSTIEEAYEVVDAIEKADFDHLKEELGDLLFQVVFYAQMGQEHQYFTFDEIVQGLIDKLLRRHPHVFPDNTLNSRVDPGSRPNQEFVSKQWESIKQQERKRKGQDGVLTDIPTGHPAMTIAHKMQKRVAEVGFDWADSIGVMDKLFEEFGELKEAIEKQDSHAIEQEFGDCLFTLVNLSRHLNIDAEGALRLANRKFSTRFQRMEKLAKQRNLSLKQLESDALEALWVQVKSMETASH